MHTQSLGGPLRVKRLVNPPVPPAADPLAFPSWESSHRGGGWGGLCSPFSFASRTIFFSLARPLPTLGLVRLNRVDVLLVGGGCRLSSFRFPGLGVLEVSLTQQVSVRLHRTCSGRPPSLELPAGLWGGWQPGRRARRACWGPGAWMELLLAAFPSWGRSGAPGQREGKARR